MISHSYLGPKLEMIKTMTRDLASFLYIGFVFITAYGVVSRAMIMPNKVDFNVHGIFSRILYPPYSFLFGGNDKVLEGKPDEKSNRMEKYVNIWSEEDEFIDRIVFVKCNKERCNPDMFEKYNVEAIPTFLFINNNEQVAPPYTVFDEVRYAAVKIEAVINGLLNGAK
ncbi:unnamed protein product [Rotaria sordida]|nr:unnamed protein product [Rotaria sordida]